MKLFKSTLIIFALLVIGLAAFGPSGCGHLDPAGAYAGDKVLYDYDQTTVTSYDVLHTFVTWEYQNRQLLSDTPEIRSFADSVRKNAPRYFASAVALRDAYQANPSPGAKSALQASLDVIRQLVREATRHLAANRTLKEPP